MRTRGLEILQKGGRRILKRLARKGLILMYHRIAEVDLDPWALCVTPQYFAEQLEVLAEYTQPISLAELVRVNLDGKIPPRAVVVTFDDGYADNLHKAKPLLEQYNIPATVFITTGYINQNQEFWPDELERILLKPGRLPDKLCLKINGKSQQWELGEAAYYRVEDYQRDGNRRAWEGPAGSRMAVYLSVWQQLEPLVEQQRQEILDQIRIWAGREQEARPAYRPLQFEELCELAQGNLVEIGAHTVTHPFLPAHPAAYQLDEMQKSKACLEQILARPVTSFAYPFGEYTAETINLVQTAGFTCACSIVEDTVWKKSNRFALPRFGVGNWNGQEFRKMLSRWFHA